MLEAQKNGSREKEIEEQFKKEREKLAGKINDLELKIYTINDEKTNLARENKKLQLQIDEFNQKNSEIFLKDKDECMKDVVLDDTIPHNKKKHLAVSGIQKNQNKNSFYSVGSSNYVKEIVDLLK